MRFRQAHIAMQVIALHGDRSLMIRNFLRHHPEVMFLAMSERDRQCESLIAPKRRFRRSPFPVPMVLVEKS